MDRRLEWQAHADEALLRRVAEAQPGDRKHLVGEAEDLGDLGDVVAQNADRTGAEAQRLGGEDAALQGQRRVDRSVEKPLERAVVEGMAAQRAEPLQASRVAEKDEKGRRRTDPRHVREERGEAVAAGAVLE